MASSIDATKPTATVAYTADVRSNFSSAKSEIEALQGAVAATTGTVTTGTLELGHASDTTLARSAAGAITVEGVAVALNSTSLAHTCSQLEVGAASDTTLTRSAAGVLAVEGVTLGRVIASGTSALGTSAISSGAAATLITTSATGVATTDVITWGFNTDPNAVTGYDAKSTSGCLVITAYPTANNVNFLVSNPTAGSITPGALTLNWRVVR